MSAAGPTALQKRKAPSNSQPHTSNQRKRQKVYDARAIPSQTADAALSRAGELNIASFVKSREYEIRALDKSMKKARQSLSTRAFQQVPRHLRRRTASHNAKKVPRRLRGRARKEMMEDNTPIVNSKTRTPTSRLRLRLETAKALKRVNQKRKTVRQKKREAKANAAESDPAKHVDIVRVPRIKKNTLAGPPLATSKFKRRQVNKTWLPTHLWHTKRAHLTRPTQPLWRMAIPLTPTEKSYRATHRASESRGCIAWDMSYTSTIGCLGTHTALEGLLKALGFHGNGWSGSKHKKWTSGTRFASGWAGSRDGKEAMAPIDVLWCAHPLKDGDHASKPQQPGEDVEMVDELSDARRRKTKLDRRILIRIHPAAFAEFWKGLSRIAKMQKPQVLVEDLRFEIGSIEVIGPASTEALANTLELAQADENIAKLWQTLSKVSNPAFLPMNVCLSFSVIDPRLVKPAKRVSASISEAEEHSLHTLVAEWPLDGDSQPSALFSHKARHRASRLPSQWALNRRRHATLPGESLKPSTNDPIIPVILLAHRPDNTSGSHQGYWSLLAPWKCIDVIWRRLQHCALSSGSKTRFGGLRERRQVAFEQMTPWFPGDFPGTEAGKAWERSEAEARFDEWIRHPPSRRIVWDKLDLGLERRGELGRGWTCDWEYLLQDTQSQPQHPRSIINSRDQELNGTSGTNGRSQPVRTQRQRKAAKAALLAQEEGMARRRNTSSPESDGTDEALCNADVPLIQLTPKAAKALLQQTAVPSLPSKPALMTIRISLLDRGTPNNAARIYRIPAATQSNASQAVTPSTHGPEDVAARLTGTPSAAQHSPSTVLNKRLKPIGTDEGFDLRSRWLALDHDSATRPVAARLKKDKPNHWGLPRKAHHYLPESLRSINVLPKNAPPEIIDEYGLKPLSEEEKKLQLGRDLAVRTGEEKVWETHVPCPDAQDLIGFVTTGNYNLAEGRGTAIGAVWLQRLFSGWDSDERHQRDASRPHATKATSDKEKKLNASYTRRRDRERHLCIVRNAGESIGRLAIWELCE